jgi:ABC-type polysaccharide/polyol phosphate transport system ATPase subunit
MSTSIESKNQNIINALEDGRPALRLDGVSVHYQRIRGRPRSLKEYVIRLSRGELSSNYFKALNNVTFQVNKGEVFGVVGRNGAGKSTLLRVLAGILRPTEGRVRIWGKPIPLLGVGAGFNPELTGRENIYLYSSVLGQTYTETDDLFDDIVTFAELADFIDTPIRMYSSGMVARLGFAVAMARSPEILLVDEVLGVGDEQFREKCAGRFREIQDSGTTIVIVTHHMQVINRMCTNAAWLHNGTLKIVGQPKEVVDEFRNFRKQMRATRRIREGE